MEEISVKFGRTRIMELLSVFIFMFVGLTQAANYPLSPGKTHLLKNEIYKTG